MLTAEALEQVQERGRRDAALRSQLAILHQRERHLNRTFADGLMTSKPHQKALKVTATERARLQKLLADTHPGTSRLDHIRSTISVARSAWDIYAVLSFAEQRAMIQTLFNRLELGPNGIVLYQFASGGEVKAA